jgi:hypothetical protein
MMNEDRDKENKEEEEKQFKKIKSPWPDNTRFRKTRKELLEKNPELMSGIPKEMRWSPERSVERSKWEETTKKWREESKHQKPRSVTIQSRMGNLKKTLFCFAVGFLIFVALYLFIPELQNYINALISSIVS